ncbi:hypothetical protein [Roseibium algae]|uniref:Uncharacterized protein n=1 Tax=Roseibium algae TaxID=3123038 RepID=A0ABU8THH1_9HYPH
MGTSYTELFFMDEVTALASGHRPCFECRRAEAKEFAAAFSEGVSADEPMKADDMDLVLHEDRLENGKPKRYSAAFESLPDAAMFIWQGQPHAARNSKALMWTPRGYEIPRIAISKASSVTVLTPACIVHALSNGYAPTWHPTATA